MSSREDSSSSCQVSSTLSDKSKKSKKKKNQKKKKFRLDLTDSEEDPPIVFDSGKDVPKHSSDSDDDKTSEEQDKSEKECLYHDEETQMMTALLSGERHLVSSPVGTLSDQLSNTTSKTTEDTIQQSDVGETSETKSSIQDNEEKDAKLAKEIDNRSNEEPQPSCSGIHTSRSNENANREKPITDSESSDSDSESCEKGNRQHFVVVRCKRHMPTRTEEKAQSSDSGCPYRIPSNSDEESLHNKSKRNKKKKSDKVYGLCIFCSHCHRIRVSQRKLKKGKRSSKSKNSASKKKDEQQALPVDKDNQTDSGDTDEETIFSNS